MSVSEKNVKLFIYLFILCWRDQPT